MGDLVSVVVPVFQAEKTISRCIESILAQDYENIELVLVDDGCSDSSIEICNRYKKRHGNILIIHEENMGPAHARNVGISVAKGKYISFVDSDDYVEVEYISKLYEAIARTNSEISVCIDTWRFFKFLKGKLFFSRKSYEAIEDLLYQKLYDVSPWGKMYLANLLRNTPYPTGMLCEDLYMTPIIFLKAKTIGYVVGQYYYYTNNPDGVMNSIRLQLINDELTAIHYVEKKLMEITPCFEKSLRARKYSCYSQILGWSQFIDGQDEAILSPSIWSYLVENRWEMILDPRSRMKNRFGACLTFLGEKRYKQLLCDMYRRKRGRS